MIPMNDFKAQPEELLQCEMAAVERVLRSGWYVLGSEVKAFESAWAQRCGVANAVGVGNGMDALEIGMRALGIGPGDEVITTPMTAFATVLSIFRCGATPVLADIDEDTALLGQQGVQRCITSRTKAVLLVHLYGQIRNMDGWVALCEANNLFLLEDCAQAHLAQWGDGVAGSFGEFGAYSFYPTKNLGAVGDGGALVTRNTTLAGDAKQVRNYGESERYHHPRLGLNSRLDEIQAAILMARLGWIDRFTERRRVIAESFYGEMANPRVTLLAPPAQRTSHVFHLFVLLCDKRDALAQHLNASGVGNLSHYPVPIHFQEPCRNLAVDPLGLGKAEAHARKCLSIPCHPQMSDSDVSRVVEAVNAFR